jgi:hypothetical protein
MLKIWEGLEEYGQVIDFTEKLIKEREKVLEKEFYFNLKEILGYGYKE